MRTRKIKRLLTTGLSVLTLLFAVLVMMGWHFEIPVLKSLLPGFISMKFNTALGLFCFAMAQLALAWRPRRGLHQVSFLFACFGTLIGAATLFEYISGMNLGIDELVYLDLEGVGKLYPAGRLAPVTALSFLLLGFGYFASFSLRRPRYRFSQMTFLITALISFQALVGYALGIETSFGLGAHTRIALHTAFSFIFLSSGFFILTVPHGYTRILTSSTLAGVTARRLIIASIFVPPLFNFFQRAGENYGLFDSDLGSLLRIVGSVVFFVVIVWRNSEKLYRSQIQRQRSLRQISRQEENISTHKVNEQELISAKQKALDATKLKSEFLANMSHELRTPLNGIIGMSKLLSKTRLEDSQKDFVETINVSSNTLLALLNDILDLSKIESGKLQLEDIQFELHSLMRSAVSIVEFSAKAKNIQLISEIKDEVPNFLIGDPLRLRQVLINLLNNAIKFTDMGSVILRVTKTSEQNSHCHLCFEVIDQGIGIESHQQDKLFESFAQGDGSTSRKYGGSGLGLSISKQLVEIMGGKIGVESIKGLGSRFFFELNLKMGKVALLTLAKPIDQETKHLHGHVLLAEDVVINQKVIMEMLKLLGCTMRIASNGMEVLDLLQKEDFDLILMDGQMPVMDGYEASRRVRSGEAGQKNIDVPILAITANAIKGDTEKCFEAGMNDYISKPILYDDFATRIEKWLKRGRSMIEEEAIRRLQELAHQGNASLLQELIDLFMKEVPEDIRQIRSAIFRGQFDQVSKRAHGLKSSCANLGILRMKEFCEKLEKARENSNPQDLSILIETLEKEFHLAAVELKKLVA